MTNPKTVDRSAKLNRKLRASETERVKATRERDKLQWRLRQTAQILIAHFGASGPMNAEDAAQVAVKRAEALQVEHDKLKDEIKKLKKEAGE